MKRFWISLLVMLMAAGCGSRPAASPAPPAAPPSPPAVEAAAPPAHAAPPEPPKPAWYDFTPVVRVPLLGEHARQLLTLEQLRSALEQFFNLEPADAFAEKLAALRQAWWANLNPNDRPRPVATAEADLDGDGRPETVMVINSYWATSMPKGAVFVIYQRDGAFRVESAEPPAGDFGASRGFVLLGTANLTGQSGAEILWAAAGSGAHTSYAYVFVTRWAPGQFENLPGNLYTSFAQVDVQGRELLLTGGTAGSAGAGLVQRASTDHYAWDAQTGQFRLVDREYSPSELGYHRLLDGINAEMFSHLDRAEAAYRSALEPDRQPLADYMWTEPQPRFGPAMRAFAAFRLRLLLLRQGRAAEAGQVKVEGEFAGLSTQSSCSEASAWVAANPDFFTVMNALAGYRNITWAPDNLCGALPTDMK